MIKLYKASESSFTNNGLGFLNDPLTCTVTEHLNGEYELEMTYPVYGIHYDDLQMDRLILVDEKSKTKPQAFRIYSISKPINQIVTIQAQHISYDLSDIAVKGALENYAYTLSEVFEYIRRCVLSPCPFRFSTTLPEKKSNMCLSKPRSVRSILGTDDNGILTLFGGEYEFDMYDVILHQRRGTDNGVIIEYGKNLTELTQEENISEMYTGVYPYYFVEDDGLQYLDDGPIIIIQNAEREKILSLDLTSEFDEMPTQELLKETAQKYITENKLAEPKVSLNVSFINNPDISENLQDIKLGDTVTVKFLKLGVNAKSRVIATTYNCITKTYDSIELGEPSDSIVDGISSITNDISSNTNAITDVKVEVKRTSDAIYQTIEDTNGNLNSLTETVSGVSRTLQNAEGDITQLQARADGIDADISNAEGDIHSLTLRADGMDQTISNAQGDINILQTRADGFARQISNAEGDITYLSSRCGTIETGVTNLSNDTSSRFTQMSDSMSQKVSRGDICSEINQSPDQITLGSNRLVINSSNFNLDASGNGKIGGWNFGNGYIYSEGESWISSHSYTGHYSWNGYPYKATIFEGKLICGTGNNSTSTGNPVTSYGYCDLSVAGFYSKDKSMSSGYLFAVDVGGKSVTTNTGAFTGSDRRLKTNISEISEQYANELIDGLKPSTYTMIDGKRTHSGFIADEVKQTAEKVLGSVDNFAAYATVKIDEDKEDYAALRYEEFIAPLTKYCQCLKRDLKKEISKNEQLQFQLFNIQGELMILKQQIIGGNYGKI